MGLRPITTVCRQAGSTPEALRSRRIPAGVHEAQCREAEGRGREGVHGHSVDVFGRRDGFERGALVDVVRDGMLEKDAVHRWVSRQLSSLTRRESIPTLLDRDRFMRT